MFSFRKSKRIYLDYASATPVGAQALQAQQAAASLTGNPGSIHAEGRKAKESLEASRSAIAAELGCKAREVVFTSGLTESNNLAILGFAKYLKATPRDKASLAGTHWITSSIEHPSVFECFVEIEKMGGSVTHLDPDERGIIAAEKLQHALRKETVFVSIGWANSEIGTLQPIRQMSAAIRAFEKVYSTQIIFHTDAGQAPLYLPINVHTLGVDLFSLGSGKLYGPRGIGALYIAVNADIDGLVIGGGQERGLRAGTESPSLAAGFAAGLQQNSLEREAQGKRLASLRDNLASQLLQTIPGLVVNGDLRHALPHMLNISIPCVNSEYIVVSLDQKGIAVSTKSACSEGRLNESHVVAAMFKKDEDKWRAGSTLRCSLGRQTTKRDCQAFADILREIVEKEPVGSL